MTITLYALALVAFALWAGGDGVTNGKELLLLVGVIVFLVWSESRTRQVEAGER